MLLKLAVKVCFSAAAVCLLIVIALVFSYISRAYDEAEEKALNGLYNVCCFMGPVWALVGGILWLWT